ncbi:MAG TPA: hypothetical protein VL220_02175 [Steroidobacteraceae bacterium]|jgi:hypothetical protein|nr:hypothetical protein [Steroidobacteraceae bacterium]
MSEPDSELDKHLKALYAGLDTRPDFDVRLMARLRVESQSEATQRAMRVQQERARYRRAVLELQSWRQRTLRLLTLDTVGVALLLLVALITAWPHLSPAVLDTARQYGPYVALLLAILIAAVPLWGMWAEQNRRVLRLL